MQTDNAVTLTLEKQKSADGWAVWLNMKPVNTQLASFAV